MGFCYIFCIYSGLIIGLCLQSQSLLGERATWSYVADGEEERGRWFKCLFTIVLALVCRTSVQSEIEF